MFSSAGWSQAFDFLGGVPLTSEGAEQAIADEGPACILRVLDAPGRRVAVSLVRRSEPCGWWFFFLDPLSQLEPIVPGLVKWPPPPMPPSPLYLTGIGTSWATVLSGDRLPTIQLLGPALSRSRIETIPILSQGIEVLLRGRCFSRTGSRADWLDRVGVTMATQGYESVSPLRPRFSPGIEWLGSGQETRITPLSTVGTQCGGRTTAFEPRATSTASLCGRALNKHRYVSGALR